MLSKIILALSAIAPAIATTIFFNADFTQYQDGPIKAGEQVTIKYDLNRAHCDHVSYKGYDTFGVFGRYGINGNFAHEYYLSIAKRNDYNPNVQVVFPEKGDLAIYFVCGNIEKTTFDSNFSKNFRFTIE